MVEGSPDHGWPVRNPTPALTCPNLPRPVERAFTADRPDRLWVVDIT